MKVRKINILVICAILISGLAACGGSGGGGGGGGKSGGFTYTVTYDGNGSDSGSVPVDANSYEKGQIVIVLGNNGNLVRSGYSFSGWNTQAGGDGTTYTQSQTFAIGSADVTLYAIWTANPTYTVTYDGNSNDSGSIPVDSTNYEQGQIVTVLGNSGNLARSGYTFDGWNTLANGNGTTYIESQTFTMGTADVTLYAVWTAIPTYTVTYDGNGNSGGSVPADSNSYEQGQTVTVLGNTGNLSSSGYLFAGWNTQAGGNGTAYVPSQTFTMGSADVTLYAQWTAVVVAVEFCNIQFPDAFIILTGETTSDIYGQVYQTGMTETPGANASIGAQVGYGPSGTDPTLEPENWIYVDAAFNAQVGNNDEYVASFTAPAPGSYSYVYRFTIDGGSSYTYCDLDGSGSLGGYEFTPDQLGSMTVNVFSCSPGLTDCGGVCLDLMSDTSNCGVCGHSCLGGQWCVDGQCI